MVKCQILVVPLGYHLIDINLIGVKAMRRILGAFWMEKMLLSGHSPRPLNMGTLVSSITIHRVAILGL